MRWSTLTALLRRGRAVSWEIAREVHPNLEPGEELKARTHAAQNYLPHGGPAMLGTLANVAYGFKMRLGHDPAILDQICSAPKDKGIGE